MKRSFAWGLILAILLGASGCEKPPQAADIGNMLEAAAKDGLSALDEAMEKVRPSLEDAIDAAKNSKLASDARKKLIDTAYGLVKTDEDQTALLDVCLQMAENQKNENELRIEALKIIGKMAGKSAVQVGKKLLDIAKDPKTSENVKNAALDALEKLDTDGKWTQEIQKYR